MRSRTGEPLIASSPWTRGTASSTPIRRTTASPMGLDRCLALWAKMPRSGMSCRPRGRRTRSEVTVNEAWCIQKSTCTWENCPNHRRPGLSAASRWISDVTPPHPRLGPPSPGTPDEGRSAEATRAASFLVIPFPPSKSAAMCAVAGAGPPAVARLSRVSAGVNAPPGRQAAALADGVANRSPR